MHLLSRQEIKDVAKEQEEKDKRKLAKILDFIDQGVRALNEFKEHDKLERERIQKEHAALVAEHTEGLRSAVANLEKEVSDLEARKVEALKPLDERIKELDEREQLLHARELAVVDREKNNDNAEQNLDSLRLTYEEKLDELEEAKSKLEKETGAFELAKENFKKIEQASNADFRERVKHFTSTAQEINKQAEAILTEAKVIKIKAEENNKEKAKLKFEWLRLADQRLTLQSAWDELKQKQQNG